MKGTCPRCAGLLILERSYFCQFEGTLSITLIRCVCCGFYNDDVCDRNRKMSRQLGMEVA